MNLLGSWMESCQLRYSARAKVSCISPIVSSLHSDTLSVTLISRIIPTLFTCWIALEITKDISTFWIESWIWTDLAWWNYLRNKKHIVFPTQPIPCLVMPWHQQAWYWLWRHNRRDSVSNHQPHDCLFNPLIRRWSKKTSKLCVTGLCAGKSPHKWPVTRKMFPFDDVIMSMLV